MKLALGNACALFWAALREIFDENAYSRFLAREGLTPSQRAYQLFMEECALQPERRSRCC
jgi:hypothetical protein